MHWNRWIFKSFSCKVQKKWEILRFEIDGKRRFAVKWKIMRGHKRERHNGGPGQPTCSQLRFRLRNKAFCSFGLRILSGRIAFLLPAQSKKND